MTTEVVHRTEKYVNIRVTFLLSAQALRLISLSHCLFVYIFSVSVYYQSVLFWQTVYYSPSHRGRNQDQTTTRG